MADDVDQDDEREPRRLGELTRDEFHKLVLGRAEPASGFGRGRALVGDPDAEAARKQKAAWHRALLGALIVQLLIVHLLFWWFLKRNNWDIDPRIWMTYLGVTLGETVGLAYIVVSHLFPKKPSRA